MYIVMNWFNNFITMMFIRMII